MPKNIVILLDGTSNGITSQRTNILRLYGCLTKGDAQLVYYDPGVGTMGAEGRWSRRLQKASEIWGMATGAGIDQNVKEAYRFLIEHYEGRGREEGARDRIYVMGFSRGAYTARMLAGFIHTIGLMEPRNLNLVNYAYRAYKRIGQDQAAPFAEARLYRRVLRADRPPIRLLGLFDTVASVIEPGPGLLPQLRHHAFTSENPGVEIVRHAVALDERRRMFRPLLWPEGQPYRRDPSGKDEDRLQDSKEVWFTGVHGDVGGGYPEMAAGLAKIPLHWMVQEAEIAGLRFEPDVVRDLVLGNRPDKRRSKPDAFAQKHVSMLPAWRVLEYLPLPTKTGRLSHFTRSRERPRAVPEGARLHASVIARKGGADAAPDNLPGDFRVEGKPADWAGGGSGLGGAKTP